MRAPDWVKHAVFYQIFPDRFARSGRVEHQETIPLKPWGSPPEEQGFQGGDLYGIIDRLDYLDELGVTALYLNPIFASAANHRYHTYDYYEVDPLLGGNEALRDLLDAAHARDMRVVLDGVFNHASRGFWPFHHVLENGTDSPYVDWFVIEDWPLRPYATSKPHNYTAWHDIPALPVLNTDHPPVREFLLGVAHHWIEFGIDGWRLDVPRKIETEGFWKDFRNVVKSINPEAYLAGEIWSEAPDWLRGDRFDGLMNYPLLDPTLSFFGAGSLRDYSKAHLTFDPLGADAFADEIQRLLALYGWEATCAQLNLLDSHDMARAQWILRGNTAALRQAVLFLMTMPGAPCIYYGDEIGLSAAGDPHCREAFPWDEDEWDSDLLSFYRAATTLRHRHEVLRTGRVEEVQGEGRTVTIRRALGEAAALVVFNAGDDPAEIELDPAPLPSTMMSAAWPPTTDGTFQDTAPTVRIPPRGTRVWTTES